MVLLIGIAALMPRTVDWRAWALSRLFFAVLGVWVWGGSIWCCGKLRLLAPPPERLQAIVAEVAGRMRARVPRMWSFQSPVSYAAALPCTRDLPFSERLLARRPGSRPPAHAACGAS
jgi:hypothetical protein